MLSQSEARLVAIWCRCLIVVACGLARVTWNTQPYWSGGCIGFAIFCTVELIFALRAQEG